MIVIVRYPDWHFICLADASGTQVGISHLAFSWFRLPAVLPCELPSMGLFFMVTTSRAWRNAFSHSLYVSLPVSFTFSPGCQSEENVYLWVLSRFVHSILLNERYSCSIWIRAKDGTNLLFYVCLMTLSTLLITVFKCTLSAHSQAAMSNVGHAVHLASLNISGEILEHSHCLISLKGNQWTLLFHNGNISWNWSHVRTKAFQSLKVPFSVLVPTVFAFLLPILHSIFRNLVY